MCCFVLASQCRMMALSFFFSNESWIYSVKEGLKTKCLPLVKAKRLLYVVRRTVFACVMFRRGVCYWRCVVFFLLIQKRESKIRNERIQPDSRFKIQDSKQIENRKSEWQKHDC